MAKQPTYDPKYISGQEIRSQGRAVRPRDAATLIIVRSDLKTPKVLMGKRAAGHKFMPNKFVFPGGRVDAGDNRIRPPHDLHPEVMRRLRAGCSENKARALALAALNSLEPGEWPTRGIMLVGLKVAPEQFMPVAQGFAARSPAVT